MKNKTFACVMGLVLALSLTACGEEEGNCGEHQRRSVCRSTDPGSNRSSHRDCSRDRYRSRGRSPVTGGSYGDPGSEWYRMELAGGMIDGVEMEEEDLNATLETYGGTLQLVFGEDGAVTMVQGGGNAEGTYEYSDDNTAIKMTLDFGGTEVTYAGFLSEVGDTVTLIAMSDMNGYDGLYFVQ